MSNNNPHNLPSPIRGFIVPKAFATIDDIVEAMEAAHLFDNERQQAVVNKWKKQEARRIVRTLKDDSGWPVYFSIKIDDGAGGTKRVYAQEALFDLEQYKQAINYFSQASVRAAAMANELTRRARAKLGVTGHQLRFPFPKK
jgi:hypothetical protein